MSTYCISDIHGCFDEFMELIKLIQFEPANDTIYILGDAIDRGDKSIECIRYIMQTKHIHMLMGNHEKMIIGLFSNEYSGYGWSQYGHDSTVQQFKDLSETERGEILLYLRKLPYYKTLSVNGRRFFLSHSGLDVSVPFKYQNPDVLVWSRDEFYRWQALSKYIVVFGHTPVFYLRNDLLPYEKGVDRYDCSIWLDKRYNDKICIDCGCVFGGALAALHLDDGQVFYVKSDRSVTDAALRFYFDATPVPVSFLDAEKLPRYQRRRQDIIAAFEFEDTTDPPD